MIQAADDAKYKMERVEKVWAREELKKKGKRAYDLSDGICVRQEQEFHIE